MQGIKQGDIKMDKICQGTNNRRSRGILVVIEKITPADIFLAKESINEFFPAFKNANMLHLIFVDLRSSDQSVITLFSTFPLHSFSQLCLMFTSPFSASINSCHCAYTESLYPLPFYSTKTFTCIWFTFTELWVLDSGMQCISYGKYPKILITDGVSIVYSSSKFIQASGKSYASGLLRLL